MSVPASQAQTAGSIESTPAIQFFRVITTVVTIRRLVWKDRRRIFAHPCCYKAVYQIFPETIYQTNVSVDAWSTIFLHFNKP